MAKKKAKKKVKKKIARKMASQPTPAPVQKAPAKKAVFEPGSALSEEEWQELEDALYEDCRAKLESLIGSAADQEIYLCTISLGSEPFWGEIVLCVASLPQYEAARQELDDEEEAEGLDGLKYNPMNLPDDGPPFALSDRTDAAIDRYRDMLEGIPDGPKLKQTWESWEDVFRECCARVLERLQPTLDQLDLTDDFIKFVEDRFLPEDRLIHWVRRTVPDAKLKQTLPGLL